MPARRVARAGTQSTEEWPRASTSAPSENSGAVLVPLYDRHSNETMGPRGSGLYRGEAFEICVLLMVPAVFLSVIFCFLFKLYKARRRVRPISKKFAFRRRKKNGAASAPKSNASQTQCSRSTTSKYQFEGSRAAPSPTEAAPKV